MMIDHRIDPAEIHTDPSLKPWQATNTKTIHRIQAVRPRL